MKENNPNKCLNCGKKISDKSTYCSDKCRMKYTRRTKMGDLPEQNDPEHTTRTNILAVTRTDKLFDQYKPSFYTFTEKTHKRNCSRCHNDFKTSLNLLNFCTPKCMESELKGEK